MFITFEGIDGSGKTTQIRLLKEKLTEEGHSVEVFREPGGTDISEKIREILLDANHNINPVTELLLFSAARSQLVAEKVVPLQESGTIVILDRFYDSTTAYQGYGRKSLPIKNIREINEIASHHHEPDLTFYMEISLEEAEKRNKDKQKDRMELSGDEFYRNVIKGFDSLAVSEERFVTLDATAPAQKVHALIWEQVAGRLS
ncbi:dTMP kinase [Balneolaceae bacterium YR4-1]|uniref:Thymidylate kinase n=1 Tax=Halalkalibaculum roseum TaxID=2709311 RepID=A0A6M1T0D0_9BACT|nr:dTMP kinase [Halalkalibaculum roseum]